MTTVFFSYSHKDEQLRDDLEVQLTMMKHEGLIEAWHDRRVVAGSDLNNAISTKLEEADVILLLVSPDFLASEYCWGVEMTRAMERHEAGEAAVIPVILRACDWHRAPFGKLLATPTDGKPITAWADRDAAFLDVAHKIRAAIEARPQRPGSGTAERTIRSLTTSSAPRAAQVRSSNLLIKKRFTQADQDDFVVRAFEFLTEFFNGSLGALEERNSEITTRFRRIDENRFTATAYRDGQKATACTIWIGGETFGSGINFAVNDSGATSATNENLTVEAGDHGLHLRPMLGGFRGQRDRTMTIEQAAEYLWERFIEPLQRH